MEGTPEGTRIHSDGLHTLVERRGGLDALGIDGICRRLTLWIDLCSSIIFESVPRYQTITITSDTVPMTPRQLLLKCPWARDFLALCGSCRNTDAIVRGYLDIQSATLFMEKTGDKDSLTEEGIMLSDKVEEVERRMVMLLQVDKAKPEDLAPGWKVVKMFAYTSLIHIYISLHELPSGLRIFDVLSQRLQLLLQGEELQTMRDKAPIVALWILLMGGFGAAKPGNRKWYASQVVDLGKSRGLEGEMCIPRVLGSFMWSKRYLGVACLRFWNDLGQETWS